MMQRSNHAVPSRGTRNYYSAPPKRPETKHDLPEIIAAQIQAVYLPHLKTELTDKQNDRILAEVEKIIKRAQQSARGEKEKK